MKIALYSRGIEQDLKDELQELVSTLASHHISFYVHHTLQAYFPDMMPANSQVFVNHTDLAESVDFLISLGGDGTILDAVALVKEKKIPILGINFGRLGFLAGIGKHEIQAAVEALISGSYVIDKRTLLHVDASEPIFGDAPFALNEFVIQKRDISAMIKIHTYVNGEFLNTYWSDGLIVSTPTGSTGYSMSCNGPIVFPESGSFIITPVAPHNLNVRPMVVPDNNIISFEIESRSNDCIVALDARREIVPKDIQLAVKKENFRISLVRLNENNFLSTIREKLNWGLDTRN
jgi:NAD+ kinase